MSDIPCPKVSKQTQTGLGIHAGLYLLVFCVSNKEGGKDPMHTPGHTVLTFQLLLSGQTDLRLLDFLTDYSSIRSQITLKRKLRRFT